MAASPWLPEADEPMSKSAPAYTGGGQQFRLYTGTRTVGLPAILHATLAAILDALHMPITVFTEPPLRDYSSDPIGPLLC